MSVDEDFVDTCLGSERVRAAWLAQRRAHRNRALVCGMVSGLLAIVASVGASSQQGAIISMFTCVTSLGLALQANLDIRLLSFGAALVRRGLPGAPEAAFVPAPHMPQPSMSAPPSA